MKTALLTTETLHHAHFAREIGRAHSIDGIVIERSSPGPAFPTEHAFEKDRERHEAEAFFGGGVPPMSSFGDVLETENINDPRVGTYLRSLKPDVVIVFGTRKISKELIRLCPEGFVNLHGGDPEEYRGLDTHLWAIYHGDFAALVATLHRLDEHLDNGDVIQQASIPLTRGMRIHELRKANTEVCIRLTLPALHLFSQMGCFVSRPQRKKGRYYSFMPAVLKESCCRTFHKYTEQL